MTARSFLMSAHDAGEGKVDILTGERQPGLRPREAITMQFRAIPLPPHLCEATFTVMRQVLNDIEAGKVSDELRRRGVPPAQRLRVVVESIDDIGPYLTAINAAAGAFDWLAEEPELYSDADLVERFRP